MGFWELAREKGELDSRIAELTSTDYQGATAVEVLAGATSEQRAAMQRLLGVSETDANALVDEFRRDGSHTLVTWVIRRGRGVPYEEIVRDVAKRLKVWSKHHSVYENELAILQCVARAAYEKLPPEDRKKLASGIDAVAAQAGYSFRASDLLSVESGVGLTAVMVGSLGFAPYIWAAVGLKAIGGVIGVTFPFVVYTSMSSALSVVLEPITGLTIFLAGILAGPAFRKTIPGVTFIAAIRAELEFRRQTELTQRQTRQYQLERQMRQLMDVDTPTDEALLPTKGWLRRWWIVLSVVLGCVFVIALILRS